MKYNNNAFLFFSIIAKVFKTFTMFLDEIFMDVYKGLFPENLIYISSLIFLQLITQRCSFRRYWFWHYIITVKCRQPWKNLAVFDNGTLKDSIFISTGRIGLKQNVLSIEMSYGLNKSLDMGFGWSKAVTGRHYRSNHCEASNLSILGPFSKNRW